MLALSRKVGEEIMIGDAIRVRVIDRKGEKIILGIAAPKDVKVNRLEIHEKKLSEAVTASSAACCDPELHGAARQP